MRKGSRGFTLIELLVVIAIIGILAAMLFPVFARARESARKTQCLANVKNIVTAINMYAADYERLFPSEPRREVIDYFNGLSGQGEVVATWPQICANVDTANPYLRAAVILDDYVKSKEVWKCPSAKLMNGAGFIVPIGANGDWVRSYRDHEGEWGKVGGGGGERGNSYGPCFGAWPSGWGGAITDSFVQQQMAATVGGWNVAGAGSAVFVQGIGANANLTNLNLSTVGDAARFVAVGDAGMKIDSQFATDFGWPDLGGWRVIKCYVMCTGCHRRGPFSIGFADWENCSWSRGCGLTEAASAAFGQDPSFRKSYTRHMGGSNLGFLDGHAKWFLADALITQSPPFKDAYFEGLCSCWPGNGVIPLNP